MLCILTDTRGHTNWKLTNFRRFAFQVAIWSLFDIVRLMELTMTLFREACPAVVEECELFADARSR